MAEIELHVHPFLGKNTLTDVVNAMDNTHIDILGLETLDSTIYPYVVEQARIHFPSSLADSAGIRLPNGKYLLNAREYNTHENLHVLTIGYSAEAQPDSEIRRIIDEGLNHGALVLLDHPFVDNGKTKTAGHISADLEEELVKICREYSGQIALEWNGYCIPWIRKVLKHMLNQCGFDIQYHDVNKKAEELSERLRGEGYNVPIVADTDLHARNRRQLQIMGTARIITNVQGECAREIVESMRTNIFSGDYENVKQYVGSLHLLECFCLPILFPRYFLNPRA